jgi:hypothetical protein
VYDGSDGEHASTTGSLFFSSRSLDKWLSGSGQEVDPEFDHDHALNDAIFFPGLNPFGAPLASCPTDRASFGSDSDGNGRVETTTDNVLLGAGATKGVARDDDAVSGGTLSVTTGVGGFILSIVYTDADGVPHTLNAATQGPVSIKERISESSAHIKAVD